MGLFDSLADLAGDVVGGTINTVAGAIDDVAELDITLSKTRKNAGKTIKDVAQDTGEVIDDTINLDL
jgi:hypothetical protein